VDSKVEQRNLTHLHYLEWPDHGVPTSTKKMAKLIAELDIRKTHPSEPIVIHCSAGIGRAGTFLAIHSMRQKALTSHETIDVMKTVLELRRQRMGAVQSGDQYKFVYAMLRDVLMDRFETTNNSTSSRSHLKRSYEACVSKTSPNLLSRSTTAAMKTKTSSSTTTTTTTITTTTSQGSKIDAEETNNKTLTQIKEPNELRKSTPTKEANTKASEHVSNHGFLDFVNNNRPLLFHSLPSCSILQKIDDDDDDDW